MVIDHIGVYFFPDQVGWRMIGRLSLPVWLFLVGYARTRTLGPTLISAAILMLIARWAFGESLLPLNILFTIILARLLIDRIMAVVGEGYLSLIILTVLFGALVSATNWLFEYGTQAFLYAMLGYLVRNRDELAFTPRTVVLFAIAIGILHGVMQGHLLEVPLAQVALVTVGVVSVSYLLTRFRARTYPQLTERLRGLPSAGLMIMGRHTLILYVVHLLLFKVLAAWWLWEHDWLFSGQSFEGED